MNGDRNLRESHLFSTLVTAALLLLFANMPAHARSNAGVQTDHYTIALLVRSLVEQDGKLSKGVQAIVDYAQKRVEAINRPQGGQPGGINGIPVRLKVLNDEADEFRAIYLVGEALKDPSLIAVYGLVSPTTDAQIVKAIGKHGVPFISELSDDTLFAGYPNIFTMQTAAGDDVRAYASFLADNYRSTIFVGGVDDRSTKRFRDAMAPIGDRLDLMSVHWLPRKTSPQYDKAVNAAIAEIRLKRPEVISLSADTSRNADILQKLAAAGLDIPIFFVNGRIDLARYSLRGDIYFGDMFELGRAIPDVVSGKLAEIKREPGYQRLKQLSTAEAERTLVYTDILSWLREAAQTADRRLNAAEMRGYLASKLLEYRPGERVFHGLSRDWSFTPTRSRSQITMIKWWLKGSSHPVIWKVQYKPAGNGVSRIPVAYFSIDMVRIVKVDSNHKSFSAEFYASVASHQNVGLDRFEFVNAMRSEDDGAPLIHSRQIDGNLPAVHSRGIRRLYKVSGRFRFDPDLTRYPFDQQPFTISVQARDATLPVFIQPPPYSLRDKNIAIEGWSLLEGLDNNYVSYDTNTVTFADKHMSGQEVVHFYKYSYTWIAERLSLNYYLRVIVPLVLILIVAYMSVFAPHSRIDSVVAIQVTSLLATIALYFSIPKFDSEIATLSDQIFVFTEALIVVMILSSILRSMMNTNETLMRTRAIMMFQAILVPVLCYLALRYVIIVKENAGVVFSGQSLKDTLAILIGLG